MEEGLPCPAPAYFLGVLQSLSTPGIQYFNHAKLSIAYSLALTFSLLQHCIPSLPSYSRELLHLQVWMWCSPKCSDTRSNHDLLPYEDAVNFHLCLSSMRSVRKKITDTQFYGPVSSTQQHYMNVCWWTNTFAIPFTKVLFKYNNILNSGKHESYGKSIIRPMAVSENILILKNLD